MASDTPDPGWIDALFQRLSPGVHQDESHADPATAAVGLSRASADPLAALDPIPLNISPLPLSAVNTGDKGTYADDAAAHGAARHNASHTTMVGTETPVVGASGLWTSGTFLKRRPA